MVIILSTFAAPAPKIEAQWVGLSVTWEGPDGSVWDLNDPEGGVLLLQDGVEGLHFPIITKHSSKSRAIPGNRRRGWRAEARDVFWPLMVYSDQGSEAWRIRQDAFFSTIHPEREGVWKVRAGSRERSLRVTGTFDDSFSHSHDPYLKGWALIPVTFEASQPYWEGEPIVRGPWQNSTAQPFFPGPPFKLSASKTLANAMIENPGDVEAWPVWTAVGPFTTLSVGVGDAVIVVPFDVPDGEVLRIDTDPRNPTATLDGVDMTAELGLQPYAAVPPGGEVPLVLTATGTGTVSCEVLPLFFRAF